jgi:NAD(P)H-hydrate epimerase
MVVDADALYAVAQHPECLLEPAGPRILTPHPGEFRRLIDGVDANREEQERLAVKLARSSNAVILLKGHRTLITDGRRAVHNQTGNPGMATGGCGDVLTGVIAALVGQHLAPFDAACLGAHVHGLAGDLAAGELGQVSLIASDLPRFLPAAFQKAGSGP